MTLWMLALLPSPAQAGAQTFTPPSPRSDPADWVVPWEYPPEARRKREQGRVTFSLRIDVDGHAAECIVTESSGSESLDSYTCGLLKRRSRFLPARDTGGTATEGYWSSHVDWVLPRR